MRSTNIPKSAWNGGKNNVLQRDVFWAIAPIIKICRVVGVSPWSVHSRNGCIEIRASTGWRIWCWSVTFVVPFINLTTYPAYYKLISLGSDGLPKTVTPLHDFMNHSCVCVNMAATFGKCILCLYGQQNLLDLITMARNTGSKSSTLHKASNLARFRIATTSFLCFMLFAYVLGYGHQYGKELCRRIHLGDGFPSYISIFAIGFGHVSNAVLSAAVDILYILWVYLCERQITALNKDITNLEYSHQNQEKAWLVAQTLWQEQIAMRVKQLRMKSWRIWHAVYVIEDTYRNIILLAFIFVFIQAITVVYSLTEMLITQEIVDIGWVSGNAVAGAANFIMFLLQVRRCIATTNQASNMSLIRNVVPVSSTTHLVNDMINKIDQKEAKEELFSLQLLHRKPQFTAGGVFLMDLSSVFTLVGGIMTYLVVLLQVQPYFMGKHTV